MRAVIAADPAPNDSNVARSTAFKFAGDDLRPDAERMEQGAGLLERFRHSEQQGREADMARTQSREQEHPNATRLCSKLRN
jgi:hypothetical protein